MDTNYIIPKKNSSEKVKEDSFNQMGSYTWHNGKQTLNSNERQKKDKHAHAKKKRNAIIKKSSSKNQPGFIYLVINSVKQ